MGPRRPAAPRDAGGGGGLGPALILLAAALALLPAAAEGAVLAALDGRSRLALALAPWLLVTGLPRGRTWPVGAALGLAAVTLSLAAWLDARAGFAGIVLLQRGLWGLACGAFAWLAAERSRGGPRHGALWMLAWLALPGLAGLSTAFRGGGGEALSGLLALGGPGRAWLAAEAPGWSASDALALGTAMLLLGAAARDAARAPAARS